MRVGYVLKRYPRYSETFIVNELLAHEAAGLEIEIFSLRPSTDSHFQDAIARVRAPVNYLPGSGVKVAELWSALEQSGQMLPDFAAALPTAWGEDALDVYQALLLAREARLKGLHHLHAHFATAATTVVRLAARFAGLPYSFTAHAKDIFHEGVEWADLERKQLDAAAVVTVSDYNVRFLKAQYGAAAARVRRIYNGLDLEQFCYEAPLERPPLIVGVGRLVEKKGFADLIEACGVLVARGCRFFCQIVGSGPEEAELRARIDRLRLHGVVELTGPRPQGEVIAHVRRGAVFVAPSVIGTDGNRDGLPTTLLEAMALGTPCVSTDVTAIPEILRSGETGLMVPQHDPPALAAALERLLGDAKERVRLASRARRLIEAEFELHRNTAHLRDIFAASEPMDLGVSKAVG